MRVMGQKLTYMTFVIIMSHLSQEIKKHEQSDCHLIACLDLFVLDKAEITEQVNEAFRRNRDIMIKFEKLPMFHQNN